MRLSPQRVGPRRSKPTFHDQKLPSANSVSRRHSGSGYADIHSRPALLAAYTARVADLLVAHFFGVNVSVQANGSAKLAEAAIAAFCVRLGVLTSATGKV